MNLRQSILLFCIISLFNSSCEKKEEPFGGDHHYLLNESLYPLLFDAGSYWVYENDIGTIDSLYLIENIMDTLGPTNVGHGYTSTYQAFNLTYTSTINGEFTEQYVGYIISRGSINGGYLYLSSFEPGDSSKNATIASILDSLVVNGSIYRNVVVMDVRRDLYIKNDMNLYYVDSIGVIKKEIKEENTILSRWLLTDYNIKFLE